MKKTKSKTTVKNVDRFAALGVLIRTQFESLDSDEVDAKCTEYEDSITEMFEVVDDKKTAVVLTHLFENEEFESVYFPQDIRPFIRKRDVFLMTLGRKDESWRVIWMTQPYH